jgi:hypothetical protein
MFDGGEGARRAPSPPSNMSFKKQYFNILYQICNVSDIILGEDIYEATQK